MSGYKKNGYRILGKYDDNEMFSDQQVTNSVPPPTFVDPPQTPLVYDYSTDIDDLNSCTYKSNGYRKLCRYDNNSNTCSEPPLRRQTYECLDGQCQSSDKEYDPINNVYNSIYECKAFCHPAIPDSDCSFENVYKSNGYRTLCSYDGEINTCNSCREPSNIPYFFDQNVLTPYCEPTECQYAQKYNYLRNVISQLNTQSPSLMSDECTSNYDPEIDELPEIDVLPEIDEMPEIDNTYYPNRLCTSKIPVSYDFNLKPVLSCSTIEKYLY
jgi:hypothetical protein